MLEMTCQIFVICKINSGLILGGGRESMLTSPGTVSHVTPVSCQRMAPRGRNGKAPLGTMPIKTPFSRVAIDLILTGETGGF